MSDPTNPDSLREGSVSAHGETRYDSRLVEGFDEAERNELDRRMAAYDADPSSGVDAGELIATLRARLRE